MILDPYVAIFTRRILMLRRIWIKIPAVRHKITQLYQHYQSKACPGTAHPDVDVDCLTPAPLPGGERRGEWKWTDLPQGPVSILLENVHWMAATLHIPSFTLSAKFDHDIHILSDPFNHVQAALPILAARVVHSQVALSRTVLQDCPAIDAQLYSEACKTLTPDQRGIMFGISTLSIADQAYLHRVDEDISDVCIFCGKCVSSVEHIYWNCDHPRLVEARNTVSDDAAQAKLERTIIENSNCLTPSLRHGIPPPLALLVCLLQPQGGR